MNRQLKLKMQLLRQPQNRPSGCYFLTSVREPRLELLNDSSSSVILDANAWRQPRASFSSLTLLDNYKNCYLTVSWLVPPNDQCLHWIQGHNRNGQSWENSPSNRKLNTSQIACFRFFFYLILLIVAVARETEVFLPPSARFSLLLFEILSAYFLLNFYKGYPSSPSVTSRRADICIL